jgi:hypothetical protein
MTESKDIEFKVIREIWNRYKLEDQTELKVKLILARIIDEGKDPLGNQIGGTAQNFVIVTIPPPNLRHLKTVTPITDMGYTTLEEDWNEYESSDGFLFKMKPNISQINRTDNIDPRGEPLYGINLQPTMKRTPLKR